MKKIVDRKVLFETMPESKAIITMAIPTFISQIITLIYNMADTFFIGRTGDAMMVAGVSSCYTVAVLITTFTNLFGLGGGNLVSRMNGKGEPEKARQFCSMAFYGSIVISILYSLVMLIFMEPILLGLGASAATLIYAKQYALIVIVIGTLPSILSVVLAHLLRNVGYSKQASWGLSGGGILNIILDPLFMFVILPKGQEVIGAAIATLISNTLACLFLLFEFVKVSKTASLSANPKHLRTMSGRDAGLLLKTGLPSAFLFCLYDISNMFLFSLMSIHGDLAVAAIGIVLKIERIPNALGVGLAQSLSPLVSYNLGSKNYPRMKKFVNLGRIYGIILMLASVLLYQLLAGPLCSIFMNTKAGDTATAAATIVLATGFLRFRCLGSPFMFLNYHGSYCLQAMGDVAGAIIHTIIRICIFSIPIMYLFNHLFAATGLSAALFTAEACSSVAATIILQRKMKKIGQ